MDQTRFLIDSLLPVNRGVQHLFRPPYGQRTRATHEYLSSINGLVVLWNIDSQDWNSRLTERHIAGRVLTLMLLWRRGIVLFHDVHPRARRVLPIVRESTANAGLVWTTDTRLFHRGRNVTEQRTVHDR